jgi:hypothetical protein
MTIHCTGRYLQYSVLDKQPHRAPGEVIEKNRFDAVLSIIQPGQEERDQRRLTHATTKETTARSPPRQADPEAARLPAHLAPVLIA